MIQHNALTRAHYKVTAAEQDMVYLLLAQLGEDDPVDKLYYIYIRDIEKITGRQVSYKDNYEVDCACIFYCRE